MKQLTIYIVMICLLPANMVVAQSGEVFTGSPKPIERLARKNIENHLAKCVANPNDRISCHLAKTAGIAGGLENHMRGEMAVSTYMTCNKPHGVCLELATLNLKEDSPDQLSAVDVRIRFDFDSVAISANEKGKLRQLAFAPTGQSKRHGQIYVGWTYGFERH